MTTTWQVFGASEGKCEKVRFDLKNKQAKETKANKQMGLPQTKKYSKENYQQNEKATGWMGEEICKQYIQ